MTAPKAHQVRIFCIGGGKYAPFLRDFLQHLRVGKQGSDALLDFRKAALLGEGQTKDGSITRFSGLRRHIPGGQRKVFRQRAALIVHNPVKLALGHIPPQIQQFPNALRRLLPCDKGCIAVLCGVAAGNTDTLSVVPNGILPVVHIEARAVFAVVLCQKRSVVLQRVILHKISADDQAAVSVIRPNAKRFINDLLG